MNPGSIDRKERERENEIQGKERRRIDYSNRTKNKKARRRGRRLVKEVQPIPGAGHFTSEHVVA